MTIAARKVWHIHRDWKPTEELTEDYVAEEEDVRGLEDILPKSTPPADKELLDSVYVNQESMEDLALKLGLTSANLRQRLKRARDRVKKSIKKD